MIHIAMLCLIRTHIQQKRPHGLLPLRHLPVLDSHSRSLKVLPKREISVVKVLYGLGVCNHGFFFEVPDEAVADAWGEEVGEEECAEEDALGSEDHCSHLPAWVGEFKEGEEVHAFVVCFFEEGLDPASELISFMLWLEVRQRMECSPPVIPLHSSDALEVSEHAGHHPGYTGDTLKKDKSCDPFLFGHRIRVRGRNWICPVSGDKVHSPAEETDSPKG